MLPGYNAFMTHTDALAYEEAGARPWGLAATLGLSLAIWYALELLQGAMGFGMDRVFAMLRLVSAADNTQALNFAVITCISTILCGALVFAAAALRVELDPRVYLGIVAAPAREWLRWLGAIALIVMMTDLAVYLAKGELLPAQWVEIYRDVQSPLLFWLALVIATPIFEELLFRGFAFAGIEASPLGRVGAVAITALAWTWIHHEIDPLEFAIIFIVGVALGVARLRTRSVLIPIAMHMLYSLISTAEIAWLAIIADMQS
ncbi:MAG: CPBP family intramembrane metalloprotease [Burkholderiales bacterium]|nr:CPBP family intramembrane metalloprotease [Burkholderiales bacterium]